MALKFKINSKAEVPAEQAGLYTERDGAFFLDVEGAVEKAKLDEFRANNIAITKERDELKQRFDGIDPDAVRALAAEKQKLEEAAQLKAGEVEKVFENRTKALKGDFDKQLSAVATERDALNARLVAIQIDQGVITVASKRGLRASAMPDITARARGVFRLVNGLPTAFDADGQTVRTGKDGVTPMTLEEWVDAQVSEAPHLFESNSGGGAAGNASGGSGAGARANGSLRNPFRRESWNLTEQMKIQKSDPSLATRLRAAA
ncbi:MAG TPA: hypothetical protein VK530_21505 [Candidatus Acidoferrum sp.]|nr:hypothetical protein [Candidatus Acidoferrum sp.]